MLSLTSKNKPQPNIWKFNAIGTNWSIETSEKIGVHLQTIIKNRIERFDKTYSRFRSDSVIAQMAKNPGKFELTADSGMLATLYRKLYEATDGALSPLVGSTLVAAGYDMNYSFIPTAPLPAPLWDDVFNWRDSTVVTTQPLTLDIGAAGKGCLVDIIAHELEDAGIIHYVIDASGDICHRGDDEERIGLENPHDSGSIIGVATLGNASLCASATNRRRWGNGWHHVLDARSGKPIDTVVATWVIADTTMVADGLATALFFTDASKLTDIANFEFVRLFADGRIEHSKDFVGQLYI